MQQRRLVLRVNSGPLASAIAVALFEIAMRAATSLIKPYGYN